VRLQGWRQWLRDATGEGHRVLEKKIVDQVLSTADNGQPWRILDFGAGTGSTTKHILSQHHVASIDAIDIKATPPHVKAYDGDRIPFPPDSFDLAIAMYVFHHIDQTEGLLRPLRTVSRRALIFEDLPKETDRPLLSQIFFGGHFLAFGQPFHTHLDRSRPEWRSLLEDVGFRILEEYDRPPSTLIPYRRVGLFVERV